MAFERLTRLTILTICPDFDIFSKTNVENTLNAIEICAQTHTKCPGHKEAPSPLRLVNVLQDKDIRLEKTSEQKIIYVALSYCWGGSRVAEKARTLEENLTARMEGFRLDSLPLTLQDAIKFVRILGIHYIWIDLLCIVQDTAEWPDEAQKMMQYYKNAYLTIVPIMSDSADTGIRPRREEPFHRKVPAPWSRHTGADQILLDAGPRFKMSDAAWNQRGWTWQERLFSSRILFIHDHRMELECWQGSWDSLLGFSEPSWSQPAFLPLSPDTVGQCLCDGSYESWCEVVCSYTTRMLTNPADCLYAFSGIIQMYSQWFSRQTVAGLWKDRLLQELVSWAPRQPMDAHSRDVPSWTWLYTEWWSKGENPIFLQLTEIGLFAPHANLEQIIDEDRPQSTKLQISGVTLDKSSLLHVLEVYRESERSSWLLSRKTPIASFDHKHDSAAGCTCPRKHQMDVCNTYNVMLSLSPPVTALLVGLGTFKFDRENHTRWWHFLMLQPKDQEDQEYRRVGTMHIEADRMDNDYGTIKKELENKSRRSIVLS